MKNQWKRAGFVLCAVLLSACAGERYHREGLNLIEEGKAEAGIAALENAVKEEPTNGEFRKDFLNRRSAVIDRWLQEAQTQQRAGKLKDAERLYQRILALDSSNDRAHDGLEALARDRRHVAIVDSASEALKSGDTDKALALLRPVLAENPENATAQNLKREIGQLQLRRQAAEPSLRTAYTKPINLEFRDANLKMVFEVLARTTGISFIFDKDVRPDLRTTVFLKNAAVEDAIDLILQTNQLQRKVLNSTTVLIYPGTPEKLKDYQDLMVKAFYLENADVKQVQNTLKTLLKTKDIVVDEKLNLLVMRDTPDAIRLAEKLVALHDMSEPEVMLEVEVLEVQRSDLLDLGIQWPNQLTLTPLASDGGKSLKLSDLRHLGSERLGASISDTTVKFQQDRGDANLLANPRIRVRNREKAKILIGDKVPVVTTTSSATGLVSDNIQYQDVGLKVDVEPDIHLQDEVAIKVGLEVSSIVKEVRSGTGTLSYQIGTRSANTVLRLKDGETQILAGLINDEDRRSASGVPGMGRLPVLGRLFSSNRDARTKTEIVLSITPHLVRNLVRPDAERGEFWSGTESALRTKPLTLQPMVESTGTESGKSDGGQAAEAKSAFKTLSNARSPSAPAKVIDLAWQGPNQVKVGEQFKVALKLKADGALRSLPFQATFDPTALQAVQISEGEFFKQNGGTTSFTSNIDPVNGKLFVTVVRGNTDGASGEETVVFVTLRALAAKPEATLQVLAASPVVEGDKQPTLALPPPYVVSIGAP